MRVGRMRHRIDLYSKSTAKNTYGEDVETFTEYASVWGSFDPLLGKEYFAAQQFQSPVEATVRIRYNSAVSDKDRILFNSTYYDILGVQNVQQMNRELVLFVREAKP